jgi:UDP-GlcNAc:undecaprenyl-phosphate GlcNAc-1-phosphate transferase
VTFGLGLLAAIAVVFAVATVGVAGAVPYVRRLAVRLGAVQDGGERHGIGARRHAGSIPSLGGLAILSGWLVAVFVSLPFWSLAAAERDAVLAIVLGGSLMALLGLLDDLWDLPVAMRLAVQFVAAGVLVANGVTIGFITDYFAQAGAAGAPGVVFLSSTASVAATLLWVVGFTNAFNFIDGVDGLSSGVAAIGSLSLLAVALQAGGREPSLLLLAALAGAAIGFLRHNAGPAKVFMGDSGAYLIGYVLAATSILGALKVTATFTVAAPLVILALPLANIAQVTVRRLRRGASPVVASNDHLHDLLRSQGRSERGVVWILWLVTLALGVAGMLVAQTPPAVVVATVVVIVVAIGSASTLRWLEVRRETDGAPEGAQVGGP